MLVLLTGGTRGVGRAAVELLADEGHGVLVGCRELAAGEAVVEELSGAGHFAVEVDVASTASVAKAAEDVRELLETRGARLGALVNNAGVLLERPGADLAAIVEPNLQVNFDGCV